MPGGSSEPVVEVEPADGLTDAGEVRVRYRGFPPETTLKVRQCIPKPVTGNDCDFFSLTLTVSDAQGAGELVFPARVLPDPSQPSEVTCNSEVACIVVVSQDLNDLATQPWAGAPISFGPGGPSAPPGDSGGDEGTAEAAAPESNGSSSLGLAFGAASGLAAAGWWLVRRRRAPGGTTG
ncbi:MAG: neocarzinostatin apoprotein domain-containing protein [Acidimicrobiales bacterium]